jgi:hypothetical protein
MKHSSWNTVAALARQNKGKKSPAQLEHETERGRLRNAISQVVAEWANDDLAEQPRTTTNESAQIMNTDQKTKLRRMVHKELRARFWDYTKFPDALANVVRAHPEFANIKSVLVTEFANEQSEKPTPKAFRAEVLREQKATGLTYSEAFDVVIERHPALLSERNFANERPDLSDSTAAGAEFQKRLDAYFETYTALDRRKPTDYSKAFNTVCKENPDLMARMNTPGRSPVNLWRSTDSDGKTPAKRLNVSGRDSENNPAQRASRISKSFQP